MDQLINVIWSRIGFLRQLGRVPVGEMPIATLAREMLNKSNKPVLSADDLTVPLIDPITGKINTALVPVVLPTMTTDSGGNITNLSVFAKTLNVGNSFNLDQAGNGTLIGYASKIIGLAVTLRGAYYAGFPNKSAWVSNQLFNLIGGNGTYLPYGDALNGEDSVYFEIDGPQFRVNSQLIGGNNDFSQTGFGGSGGNVQAQLDGTRTSFSGAIATGTSNGSLSGGIPGAVIFQWYGITHTAVSFTASLANNSYNNQQYTWVPITFAMSGAVTSLTFSPSSYTVANTTGNTGDSFDFSGCPLNQASVDAILIFFANSGVTYQTLNLGGSCATPSSAGMDAYNTLIGNNWTATTN